MTFCLQISDGLVSALSTDERKMNMICRKCHLEIPDGSAFCNHCGSSQLLQKKGGVKKRGNGQGSVYKRGKTWQIELTLGKDAAGARIRKFKGGFSTKKEAMEYIPTLRNEVPKEVKTLQHYYDSFESSELERLGKTTKGAYRIAWRRLESIRNVPMKDMSVVRLRDLVADEAPTFDPASDMKSLLSHLFKLAIADGEVSVNMSEYILLPPKKESERTPWTKEEQQVMWEAYAEGDVMAAYLLLMIYTGMMPGELRKCKRSMVDLKNKVIIGAGLKTKTRKATPIVLADLIIPVIQTILTYTPDEDDENTNLLFMDKTTFYEEYHIFTEKYHVRDLPVYSCRHTTATALALAEVKPSVIQKVMRHARFSTTERYIHPDTSDALEAVNIVGNRVGNSTE